MLFRAKVLDAEERNTSDGRVFYVVLAETADGKIYDVFAKDEAEALASVGHDIIVNSYKSSKSGRWSSNIRKIEA